MTTSLILLVALQAFWLRNSYEKAHGDLLAETTRYVREAVSSVRDSMLMRSIQALPPDTDSNITFETRVDSTIVMLSSGKVGPRSENQMRVYFSPGATSDSTKMVLRSLAAHVHDGRLRGGGRYTIRMRNDSLNMDSVRAYFTKLLHGAGKDMEFTVTRVNVMPSFPPDLSERRMRRPRSGRQVVAEHPQNLFSDDLQTEWVQIDPMARYMADLSQVRPLLLRQIAPQILFSVFLTSLTGLSFVVMFRSMRSQQRLMTLKNDFISNITHELKTPIATVSVALEALKNFKGIDNPKLTSEYLDIAQLELGRLSMLTEKVMTASLFDERGVVIEQGPVNLGEKVSSVLGAMKLVMDKAGATVKLELEGTDFTVKGSDIHLTNVLYNLLDNALKYSPGSPTIRVQLRDMGAAVQLLITDQGIGIPTEYQSRIFEKFFRVPSGDVHNTKGYGLGLSYVDQVVRKHRGDLTVSSEPGKGSTFTITLPKVV